MSAPTLLAVDHLQLYFPVKSGLLIDRTVGMVHAVDDVSLRLREGQTLGLVGESGCGKTTLARCMVRLLEPTDGAVTFRDQDITRFSRRELKPVWGEMQIVFQDPVSSLNPRKRVGQIVSSPLRLRGWSSRDAEPRVRELLDMVGLSPEHIDRFPHEFSGGQRQRIGLARALALEPKLIVLDEPVSALDASVQAQVINLLDDLQDQLRLSYIFVAHDLSVVRHISDQIAVMYLGKLVEMSSADGIYAEPKHPYTASLLQAIPIPDPDRSGRQSRNAPKGELPSPIDPPSGCRFHSRCPFATQLCIEVEPPLTRYPDGHMAACHHPLNVTADDLARAVRSETSPLSSGDVLPTEPAAVVGAHPVEQELEGQEQHPLDDEPARS